MSGLFVSYGKVHSLQAGIGKFSIIQTVTLSVYSLKTWSYKEIKK